jgi:uncharacterized protein (UPF0297 family)
LEDWSEARIIDEIVRLKIGGTSAETGPAKNAANAALTLTNYPYLQPHIDLLTNVSEDIRRHVDGELTAAQTIDEIRNDLFDMGRVSINNVGYIISVDHRYTSYYMNERNPIWQYGDASADAAQAAKIGANEHKRLIEKIIGQLKDLRVSDTVVAYLLDPTIGSGVTLFMRDPHMPFFFHVFPRLILRDRDYANEVCEARYPDGPPEDGDGNDDDEVLESYEREFWEQYKDTILNPRVTKSNLRPSRGTRRGPRGRGGHTSRGDRGRGGSGRGRHTPPRGHRHRSSSRSPERGTGTGEDEDDHREDRRTDEDGGTTSTGAGGDEGPDDSSYIPNPLLAMKIRPQIERVQNGQDTFEFRDHMKRFDASNESAVSLSRSMVRPYDMTVTAGRTSVDQRYVVTFTRRHKKPIFNPIMGI